MSNKQSKLNLGYLNEQDGTSSYLLHNKCPVDTVLSYCHTDTVSVFKLSHLSFIRGCLFMATHPTSCSYHITKCNKDVLTLTLYLKRTVGEHFI